MLKIVQKKDDIHPRIFLGDEDVTAKMQATDITIHSHAWDLTEVTITCRNIPFELEQGPFSLIRFEDSEGNSAFIEEALDTTTKT